MADRWTVLSLLQWSADYFAGKGIDSARLDAELLLAATLNLDRVGLYLQYDRPMAADELADYKALVQRRARREPLQYILGETEFWSLTLAVSPAVLVPRADTEVLVEEALQRLTDAGRVLDVGTGSGAIAIALASERPQLTVTAIDRSPEALAVAAVNVERHRLAGQIALAEGDLAALPDGPFEMVVSNPPYVPTADWEALMPEVHDYEPRLALDGGTDGLDAYRHLARQARHLLVPGGWLLVEVGIDQADAVATLFAEQGLTQVGQRADYAGVPRVVAGCSS